VYPLYGNKVAAPYSVQTYIQEKSTYFKKIMLGKVHCCLSLRVYYLWAIGTGIAKGEM